MNPKINSLDYISSQEFMQYCACLDKMIMEQLKTVSRFNLLRSVADKG